MLQQRLMRTWEGTKLAKSDPFGKLNKIKKRYYSELSYIHKYERNQYHLNEIFFLIFHMYSDWFLTHVRFIFYTVAPSLASTPLPGTEHDKKKGNQETKMQEVPGHRILPFL